MRARLWPQLPWGLMVAMMGALNLTSWWGRPVMAGGEGPQFPSVPHHPIIPTESQAVATTHGTLLSTRDTYTAYTCLFMIAVCVSSLRVDLRREPLTPYDCSTREEVRFIGSKVLPPILSCTYLDPHVPWNVFFPAENGHCIFRGPCEFSKV